MFSCHSNLNSQIPLRAEFECFSDLICCLELATNVHFKFDFESIEFGLIESQCDHFHFIAYGLTLGHETQAHQGPPPREGIVAPFMFESEYCACTSPALFVRLCFGLLVIVIPRPLR